MAISPAGKPLTDLVTIEVKRGYPNAGFFDLLELTTRGAKPTYELFFEQTIESHKYAQSYAWMLISRRDQRQAVCFIPFYLLERLLDYGAFNGKISNKSNFNSAVLGVYIKRKFRRIFCCPFDDFLDNVTPYHVKQVLKENKT